MVTINPCDFSNPIPCGVNPAFTYTRYPCDQDDPRPTDTRGLPVIVDWQTPVKAEVVNRHRESILAIEGELGIQPSGTYTTVRARLDEMESLLCAVWESIGVGVRVLYNTFTVTNDTPVKEINFFGAGVTITEDANFSVNGRVNVYIPCCGGSGSVCIDGYQPIQDALPVSTNGQTSFTLSLVPYNNVALLFIGGLKQSTSDYTVVGSSLTWTGATTLLTADIVEVFYDVFHNTSMGNIYEPIFQNLPVLMSGQTTFALSGTPKNNLVVLFVDGEKQAITNYTVSGNSITWLGPSLLTIDTVQAYYTVTGISGNIWQPITQSLPVTITGQLSFTLSSAPWNNLVLLFIDGIQQNSYTVTGTTLTWTGITTLIPSDIVEVLYFNQVTNQCIGGGGGGGGGGSALAIADEGNVFETAATLINFTGTNVVASSLGTGLVQVTIAGTNNVMNQDVFIATAGQVIFPPSLPPINQQNAELFIDGVSQTVGDGYDYILIAPSIPYPDGYVLYLPNPEITPGDTGGSLIGGEHVVLKYLIGQVDEATPGPPGPQGLPGPAGADGSIGPQGNDGYQGVPGGSSFPILYKHQDIAMPDGYYRIFEYTTEGCVPLVTGVPAGVPVQIPAITILESDYGGNGNVYSPLFADASVYIELELVTNVVVIGEPGNVVYRSVYQATMKKNFYDQLWDGYAFVENNALRTGPAYTNTTVPVTGNIGNPLLPAGTNYAGSVILNQSGLHNGDISISITYPPLDLVIPATTPVTCYKLRIFGNGRYS